MPKTTIGFVGFGVVARCLAGALAENGAQVAAYDVLLERPGGLDKLKERADPLRVMFVALPELLTDTGLVLSAVTTDVAAAAATACAPHLRAGQIFVDLNATSPQVKRTIAGIVAPAGAEFVEAAILGAIGVTGAQTRILMCGGKAAAVAEQLSALGLNAAFYGAEIGRASAFKLLRSVFSKGMEALLVEALLAARRAGVAGELWREMIETMDERPFAEVAGNWVRTHGSAHVRRYHEMVQVEQLLRELEVDPVVTQATVAMFERSTRLKLAQALEKRPDNAEQVVAALDYLLRIK